MDYKFSHKIMKLGSYCTILALIASLSIAGFLLFSVYLGDNSELEKSAIVSKIKEETTLYYLDEDHRIGSFFDSRHRRYISIDEIPVNMINSIIAVEDKNFYRHFGVDPIAIAKAAFEGILNGGKFRRGGSTITQQTVKNISNDWEASFARKFREMIKSLQLERLYSKKQILEFYLNQFHVSGNGNGIGIAAKYYFNKEVKDLILVEAAFIAGSLKGPNKYNPFVKNSTEAKEKAQEFADIRKNYVLTQMFEQKLITEKEYDDASDTPVPFNRGEFRSGEVTLGHLIKTQLLQPEVREKIGIHSENDLNTSGLKVYTTIDFAMQKAAQTAIRKNLSRLETILEGFKAESAEKYVAKRFLEAEDFEYGKVTEIRKDPKSNETEIHLTFGLPKGVITQQSLRRYAKLLDMATGKGEDYQLKHLMASIREGDILYVQIASYDKKTNSAILELEKRPAISGGMIALDKGEVRAVVSGFDTLGYSRAVHAKRQAGSAFKSLAFFAAIQMGWSILDQVENIRQIFPYQGRFYFPRPDHKSPYHRVSILWAGIMSENLATVALGSRLLEKLNYAQFLELMAHFGFKPEPGESSSNFHYRVSREIGVSINNEGIKEYQLVGAINEIAPDLIFSGDEKTLEHLKLMWWGNGYQNELNALRQRKEDRDMPREEIKTRIDLVTNNFLRTEELNKMLKNDWQKLQLLATQNDVYTLFQDSRQIINKFRVIDATHKKPVIAYFATLEKEDISCYHPLQHVAGRELTLFEIQEIWGDKEHPALNQVTLQEIRLNGKIPSYLFETIANKVQENYEKVLAHKDPYLLYRYYQHHDFKIGLGLYYLKRLAKAMGVENRIDPVLSLPLGSNDVTTAEVAKIYQTFINGKVYRFFDKGADNQINYIRRIEDRNGNILYQPIAKEHQLVPQEFALQMRELLRRTVTHGTGRRARGELYVAPDKAENNRIRIPAFGKTGTTNDYRTSYFAGFIPFPIEEKKPLDASNSYTLSSYVGYDLNRMMTNGRLRIYGHSGALPMWTDFAKKIIEIKEYAQKIDPFDLKTIASKEWPMAFHDSMPYMVELPHGIIMRSSNKTENEIWQTTNMAQTGETLPDLFALSSNLHSVIYLANDPTTRKPPVKPFQIISNIYSENLTHKTDDVFEQNEVLVLQENLTELKNNQ